MKLAPWFPFQTCSISSPLLTPRGTQLPGTPQPQMFPPPPSIGRSVPYSMNTPGRVPVTPPAIAGTTSSFSDFSPRDVLTGRVYHTSTPPRTLRIPSSSPRVRSRVRTGGQGPPTKEEMMMGIVEIDSRGEILPSSWHTMQSHL
eukprot:5548688-Amphidinium_carterae.1